MDNIIQIENLCFSYDSNLIFEQLSLNIERGSFVGIVGKNGSGKSTLLKLILGENKPICGDIKITPKTKIGYVEQMTLSNDLSFPASVFEIVMLGLYKEIGMFHFPKKEHTLKVMESLKAVGLEGFEKKQISYLSGGEGQKVLIAKALVSDPDLIILDEPTTGIDSESVTEFMRLIKRLNQKYNKTIIMVTHNLENLSNADKVYEIRNKGMKVLK